MSIDTIYQQLRGHLHYLKLAAIAEQLAPALEHARTRTAPAGDTSSKTPPPPPRSSTASDTTPRVVSITGDSYRMRRHRDAIASLRPPSPDAHKPRNPHRRTWGISPSLTCAGSIQRLRRGRSQ
jgi:hypothetical protein